MTRPVPFSPAEDARGLSRRSLLRISGLGFGALACSWMLAESDSRADEHSASPSSGTDLEPRAGHFPGQAKAVVMFMQNGGPSQMDIFDPKPELNKREGQVHSRKVEMFQRGSEGNKLLGTPFKFRPHGACGMELSEVIPHIASLADDLCLVRSMHGEHNNHTESLLLMSGGKIFQGRPALGSWISYALGTVNRNLPSYVVLRDPAGYNTTGNLLWQNAWLPAVHRGVEFSTKGAPVLNLRPSGSAPPGVREADLEFLARLNEIHRADFPRESELDARIRNFELAARMQLAAGDVLDLSRETAETRALYGVDQAPTAEYAARCLMARRLIEAGVRFVQIYPPVGQPWDAHGNVKDENEKICGITDRPSAALIQDLKRRGLLEETIVLWTGEFGRLPVSQNGKGRDHNRNAFSLFLAGGGFKKGYAHGRSDDVGYASVEDKVSVPDLHATLLHQLGIDHDRLVFHRHGRDETLTDSPVSNATVVRELLDSPRDLA